MPFSLHFGSLLTKKKKTHKRRLGTSVTMGVGCLGALCRRGPPSLCPARRRGPHLPAAMDRCPLGGQTSGLSSALRSVMPGCGSEPERFTAEVLVPGSAGCAAPPVIQHHLDRKSYPNGQGQPRAGLPDSLPALASGFVLPNDTGQVVQHSLGRPLCRCPWAVVSAWQPRGSLEPGQA